MQTVRDAFGKIVTRKIAVGRIGSANSVLLRASEMGGIYDDYVCGAPESQVFA
jgi:hypothetical protein